MKYEMAPIHGGQGETKKEAGDSSLVGGRFPKQELTYGSSLRRCKKSRSHLPPESYKFIERPCCGFSHVSSPGGLTTTKLQL